MVTVDNVMGSVTDMNDWQFYGHNEQCDKRATLYTRYTGAVSPHGYTKHKLVLDEILASYYNNNSVTIMSYTASYYKYNVTLHCTNTM